MYLVIPAVAVAAAALAMTSTGSSAVVSPGSAGRIAYYRHSPPCRLDSQGGKVCSHGIWTGNLDGSAERRLTPLKLEVLFPEWSPNGDRIAYQASTGRAGVGELWVMKADGSGKRKLPIVAPYSYEYGNLISSWSPDGKTIIIAGWRSETRKGTLVNTPIVLVVPVNGAKPRELFALPRGKYRASVSSPRFLASGKLIAFVYSRDCCSSGLYVSRPDGSSRKRLSSAYAGDPGRALDWSPDGRRIVFARQVNNGGSLNPELHVINADGTGLRRLTSTEGNNSVMTPSWSPDGRQIVFKSGEWFNAAGNPIRPGEFGGKAVENRFAVVNADGSGLHLVGPGASNCVAKGGDPGTNWCYASDPSWQPR